MNRTSIRSTRRRIALATILLLGSAGATAVLAQSGAGGGTVVYWMTAETTSGMGSMMGGGRPNMAAMMMGGRGGGSDYAHSLQLQLGSPRRAAGEPNAEHLPPAGLQAGQSLPLVTPRNAPAGPAQPWTGQMEKPKGRMLIYWGCGDRARPGQPVVLDYAAMAAGKMPPAFATINTMNGPAAGKNPTYGEWPNSRSQARVPAGGSLVGEHLVRGNYTPDIKFSLAQGQDFLAPIALTGNTAGAAGSVPLAWRPIANARAWFVATMGSARNGDMILWSSSESQAMPMMMSQVSPDEINRLVQSRVLLPASATSCTVPAEVAKAAEGSVLMTTAFGPEANFSHPARPTKAPAGWRPEWTVKLLTKSGYTGLLGMDMSEMMGGRRGLTSEDADEAPRPQQPQRRRNPLGGIGRILGQ